MSMWRMRRTVCKALIVYPRRPTPFYAPAVGSVVRPARRPRSPNSFWNRRDSWADPLSRPVTHRDYYRGGGADSADRTTSMGTWKCCQVRRSVSGDSPPGWKQRARGEGGRVIRIVLALSVMATLGMAARVRAQQPDA